MHLSSQSHSADCYPLGSITIDFEGAWAQKWAQRTIRVEPSTDGLTFQWFGPRTEFRAG
jgi:hypothetical protein